MVFEYRARFGLEVGAADVARDLRTGEAAALLHLLQFSLGPLWVEGSARSRCTDRRFH